MDILLAELHNSIVKQLNVINYLINTIEENFLFKSNREDERVIITQVKAKDKHDDSLFIHPLVHGTGGSVKFVHGDLAINLERLHLPRSIIMPSRAGDAMAALMHMRDDEDRKASLIFLAGMLLGRHFSTPEAEVFFYSANGNRSMYDPMDPNYKVNIDALKMSCFQHQTPYIKAAVSSGAISLSDYSNSYLKLSYYALISFCKKVTTQNSEFLKKRYSSYMASTGQVPYNGNKDFVNPDTLVPILSTFYSNPLAVAVRRAILLDKHLPENDSICENMTMIMRYYGCKHIELIRNMIFSVRTMVWTDQTFTDEVERFLKEYDTYDKSKSDIAYAGSIGRLPVALQQSNFPVCLYVVRKTTEGTMKNYKMKKAKFPTARIDELMKTNISVGTNLTRDQKELLANIGIDVKRDYKKREAEIWTEEVNHKRSRKAYEQEFNTQGPSV